MFDLCQKGLYEKKGTIAIEGSEFELLTPHMGLYAKSPYYVGANMWNRLPVNVQNMNNKEYFKGEIRSRLNNS